MTFSDVTQVDISALGAVFPAVRIVEESTGDIRAFAAGRCVAIAWRRAPWAHPSAPLFNVYDGLDGFRSFPVHTKEAAIRRLRLIANAR